MRLPFNYILLLVVITFFIACQPENKKYYIYTTVQEKDFLDSHYSNRLKVDSVSAISDSAAYFQGVVTYLGNLKANELIAKKGVEPYKVVTSFEVRNENQENIKYNLSPGCLQECNSFISSHGGKVQ